VRILLDTQILVWQFENSPKLKPKYSDLILDPMQQLFVSDVSLWEVAVRARMGKLDVDYDRFEAELAENP
jgi:PIN domain nuclease of toxin-antitoxin system